MKGTTAMSFTFSISRLSTSDVYYTGVARVLYFEPASSVSFGQKCSFVENLSEQLCPFK